MTRGKSLLLRTICIVAVIFFGLILLRLYVKRVIESRLHWSSDGVGDEYVPKKVQYRPVGPKTASPFPGTTSVRNK